MSFLERNLDALRARTGHAPVLGPIGAQPRSDAPGSFDLPASAADPRLASQLSACFVIGAGAAMIETVVERYPAAEVLAFEPDPAAASRLLETRDWSDLIAAGRLAFFVGPDYQGSSSFWRPSDSDTKHVVLVDPRIKGLHEESARAEALVDRLIQDARANADARRAHAAGYLLHTLANTATIAREGDVAALFGLFPGVPAVVVGAGPSLDGRLGEIREIADRAIVIASAAAARPLLASDIAPHFIVSVDPTEAHAAHLSGLQARGSWLVAEGSLHPSAFAGFERRAFVFNVSDHHPWPWLRSLGLERGGLATWGSAATSALDLALCMGCAPVLLAGLDFAFTGGRPCCRGTTSEAQWAIAMSEGQSFEDICRQAINRWPMTVEPDVHGGLQRTAPHLVSCRNYIREQIEAASHVRFMNVTPGGILHHRFVEQCTAAEAIGAAPVLDRKAVAMRLRAAHHESRGRSESLFKAIDALLDGPQAAASPLAAWAEFAPGIRRDMFLTALRSADHDAWSLGRTQTPAMSAAPAPDCH